MKCNICQSNMTKSFENLVLDKYEAEYFQCPNCGFLQVKNPTWLEEAYSDAICATDIGLLNRNIHLSKKLTSFLYFNSDVTKPNLDVGGGLGVLTRLMRDNGLDFYWSDLYCENQFAQGFSREESQKSFESLSFFEVFEHLENPTNFLDELFSKYDFNSLIFSTELFHGEAPKPKDWWYYTFHTGQHIAFYQLKTLETIATKYGVNLYSHKGIHVFSKKKLNRFIVKLSLGKFSNLIFPFINKILPSKLESDYLKITN